MKVAFKEPEIPDYTMSETYENEQEDKIICSRVRHFVSDNIVIEFIIFVESKDIVFVSINYERFTDYLFEKISAEDESMEFDTIGKYVNSDKFKEIVSKYIDYKSANIYLPEFQYSIR